MTDVRRSLKKSGLFILLTFAANWLMAGVFYWAGGKLQSPAGFTLAIAYMFVPLGMAVLVQKVVFHEALREPLGISFKFNAWFIVAWLLPPVIAVAALGVALHLPGITFSPDMAGMVERFRSQVSPEALSKMQAQIKTLPVFWIALAQGLVAGATVNAVAAFGEEAGWRGLLLRELGFLGFWRSSFIIGLIWGIWHAPLILMGHNFPQHPREGVFLMIDFCLLLAPILAYVRLKARSVIAAAVLHGTLNGTAGLAVLWVRGGSDLTSGVTGLSGLAVLLAVNLLLYAYDRWLAKEKIISCLWPAG
jgi:uncharacterized protein